MGQNQSSAPWFRPPNTLCNTDGWRRTWKSTSKITVRSAKKQERLKKKNMERKTKVLLSVTSRCPCSLLTQDVNHRDTPLCHLPGLSHLLTYTSPFSCPLVVSGSPQTSRWPAELPEPGEVSVGADLAEQRGWVCCLWFSEGREHRQDVLVIIMAPAEISVVQSFCCFHPRPAGNLIIFRMLLTWD